MDKFIDGSRVFLDVPLADKDAVLRFVSEKAVALGICDTAENLLADLYKREGETSTGLQDGFAIPHSKSPHVFEPSVIFVRTVDPIAWETLDGGDVRCVFALLVPESDGGSTHLRLISKLAMHLLDKEFKSHITASTDPDEICEYIAQSIA
ncbi:PTS sugar transporter subunit IIA [Olsenella uli]|uniref:PTS sugar transporter subunit IIA n=1 Tax=Olsenella uli TaxID=133926 RepID=UPI0016514936|nr:PTS sugar transporter subunit IIA [Olsenella uli]